MAPVIQVVAGVALFAAPLVLLSVWNRLRFARNPRSFRCRLGRSSWRRRGGGRAWRRARAMWVGDVLLLQSGVLRFGLAAVPARIPSHAHVEQLPECGVRGLGTRPVLLRLLTEGEKTVEVAAAAADRTELVGPFLAAAIAGLPRAPREQGI